MDWKLLGNVVAAIECALCVAWLCWVGIRALCRLPASHLLAFVFLAVGATLVAQKTNNVPNLNAPLPQMMQGGVSFQTGFTGLTGFSGALPHTTSSLNPVNLVNPVQNNIPVQTTIDDISRGWRIESVTTNAAVSYAMPSNATLVGNWHVHGAASSFGNNRMDFGDFAFPIGTNNAAFSAFWHFVDGRIRPTPRDAAREICAVGAPMSVVPGQSCLWTAEEPDGARVITWDNFFLCGDTNSPVNAQIRLYANGDFMTRSNEVETVCRRINPDDWDGDGIPNDMDTNPVSYDGDFFGPANILPEGANSNAYVFVDVVVSRWDALVEFKGEGTSNYPDPCFIARAGTTNSVVVLIGKSYEVSSAADIVCVGVSDPDTVVTTLDSRRFRVLRPVTITFAEEGDPPLRNHVQTRSGSGPASCGGFTAQVLPSCLGGEFFFVSCCPVEGSGQSFSFLHDPYCNCRGCQAHGRYAYEGFSIPFMGVSCCCSAGGEGGSGGYPSEEDPPSASNPIFASFSLPFALYEDSYLNEVGGARVGARARPVAFNGGIYGGNFGGSWTLTVANEGKLRQVSGIAARSGTIAAGAALSLEIEYAASSPSDSAGDIVATLTFTENFTGSNTEATASLTAVKLELEALATICEATRRRHVYGVAEDVSCTTVPSVVPGLSFNAHKGMYDAAAGLWTCPVSAALEFGGLSVRANGNTIYEFMTTTTPPTGIVVEHAVGLDFNVPVGTAGGAGMMLDLYTLPKSVSFAALSLAEVPTNTEGPTGYFTNMEFSAVWFHTSATGAGGWHDMRGHSFWFQDEARMGDPFPPHTTLEWGVGSIVWDVPIAWDLASIDDADKTYNRRIPILFKQRFDFTATGTLRVSKYGCWEERDPDDSKRASEGITTWIECQTGP